MCHWPSPEISGTVLPMINGVGAHEDIASKSLTEFGALMNDVFVKEAGVTLVSSVPLPIANREGLKSVFRTAEQGIQLTNYMFRTTNNLVILRWIIFVREVAAEQPFVEEAVKSFYYFGAE